MTTAKSAMKTNNQITERLLTEPELLRQILSGKMPAELWRQYMDIPEVKEKLLRDIVHYSLNLILIRPQFKDWKIGLIGPPGECKTIGAVKILLYDYMFHRIKCYSNMKIKYELHVSDDNPYCEMLGIEGGGVIYESEQLDKIALFRMDEKYRGTVIFADEINLELAEARRSSSNVNLNLNKVGQELRHLEASLIYTCISEMWADARIRDLTDLFIKSADTALDPKNLLRGATAGVNSRWNIYTMTRRFNGYTYKEDRKPLGPYYQYVRNMWEAYDTFEMQADENLQYGTFMKQVKTERSADVQRELDEWGWVEPIAAELCQMGMSEVPCETVYNHPEVLKRGIAKSTISAILNSNHNIIVKAKRINGRRTQVYVLPEGVAF